MTGVATADLDDLKPATPVRRRPWLAGLLSLLMPGLGQAYNTRLRRGLVIYGVHLMLGLALVFAPSIPAGLAFLVLLPVFIVFLIVDAIVGARRAGAVELRWFNRWWIYVLALAASTGVTAATDGLKHVKRPVQAYNIPAGSMVPTLLVGDYMWSERAAPQRGMVMVFKRPPENQTDFIKRIVGLPGDRVQVKGGALYINGAAVQRERIEDFRETDPDGNTVVAAQYRETLGGRSYRIIERFGDRGPLDNTAEFVVPDGHYFAMGDNRDNSADSRGNGTEAWFVPEENMIGRAGLMFYSVGPGDWPGAIRFDRMGRWVE